MNKTKFLKFAIAVLLGAGLAGALYAQLQIESTIDNSVMTIKQINLTADGKDGTAVVTIDGSSTTPLKIQGSTSIGDTTTNKLSGQKSTILGGKANEISGDNNIVGGNANKINGSDSVIPGGKSNIINANYSFAAGNYAVVNLNHHGTFVWSDSQGLPAFQSTAPNQFLIRADGGVAMGKTSATAPRAGYMLTVVGSGHFSGNLQVGGVGNRVQAYRYCNEDGTSCVDIEDIGSGLFVRSNINENNIYNANTNNVGIGTNEPSAKLHVNGSVKLEGLPSSTQTKPLVIDTNGQLSVSTKDLTGVAFNGEVDPVWMSQSGSYVRTSRTITAGDGLSGGGNLTANRTLDVDSSVVRTGGTQTIAGEKTFTNNTVFNGNVKVNNSAYLLEADATGGWARRLWIYPRNGDGGISFGAFGSATTTTYAYIGTAYNSGENLRVYKDGKIYLGGNVGIGTTAPTTKMDINGNLRIRTVGLDNTATTGLLMTSNGTVVQRKFNNIAFNGETDPVWMSQSGNFINTSSTAQTKAGNLTVARLISTQAAGTAPFAVTSNTVVTNLNSDLLDGQNATYFLNTSSTEQTKNGNLIIGGDLTVQGKVITDTLVNRTVENITVSGALIGSAPFAYRNLGSATTGWSKIFASLSPGSTETTVVVKGANNELKTRPLDPIAFDGIDLDNYVTIGGTQTITGQKTFTNSPIIVSTSVNNSVRGGLQLRTTNISRYASINAYQGASNAYMGLDIQTSNNAAPTSAVRITPNGNVGIGTGTPQAKLHVNGSVIADAYYYKSILPDDNQFSIKMSQWNDSVTPAGAIYYNSGNVGIGTNSPSSKLSFGTYYINSATPTSSEQTSHIRLYDGGAINYGFGVSSQALNIAANQDSGRIRFYTNSLERMQIAANGSVGIGTTTPGAKLDVNGNIKITTPGSSWISGKTSNGGLTSTTKQTTSSYHPMIRQTTSSNHVINLGGLGDIFGFFGYDAARTLNGYDYTLIMNLANGYVGIGTTSPSTKLQVSGVITANGGNSTQWNTAYGWGNHSTAGYLTSESDPQVGTITTNGRWCTTDGSQINCTSSAPLTSESDPKVGSLTTSYVPRRNGSALANGVVFDNGTNVGIGNTSPSYKLHVAGDVYAHGGWFRTSDRKGYYSQSYGIHLYPDSASYLRLSSNYGMIFNSTTAYDSAAIGYIYHDSTNFGLLSANGTRKVKTNNGGVELAGEVSIPGNLTLGGDVSMNNQKSLKAKNSAGTYETFLWPRWSDNIMYLNYGSAGFHIRNNASTTTMFMTNAGNVGIGTTSPSYKLHVAGDIYANGGWLRTSGSAGWYNDSYGGGWYMTDATWIRTYGSKNIYQNAGILRTDGELQVGPSGDRFYVNSAGNVGIGKTTPTQKLDVNGNVVATAFYYSSDITLKKDLAKISNPLDKILALNGYYFTWKSDNTKDIGVIAQEVEKVFPDAVTTDSKGLKSVKYGNLVAPIIEAIKELYNKYLDQQKKIDELEIRIHSLEKLLK